MSGQDELEALTHELKEFEHADELKADGRTTETGPSNFQELLAEGAAVMSDLTPWQIYDLG